MSAAPYRDHDPNAPACRCGGTFAARSVAATPLLECSLCQSIFVGLDEVKKLITPDGPARELISLLPKVRAEVTDAPEQRCPICRVEMEPRERYLGTRETVRPCAKHGICFKTGDLRRVLTERHDKLAALEHRVDSESRRKTVLGVRSGVLPILVILGIIKLLSMLERC